MRKDAQVITGDEKLSRAAEILLTNKYGCLPVVQGDKLVGIVTEADFITLSIQLLAGKTQADIAENKNG